MYKTDMPTIRDFVYNNGPKALDSVFYFVLGSIRVKFLTLPVVTNSIIEEGARSRHIWGNKTVAYEDYNRLDKIKLMDDIQNPAKDTVSLSRELAMMRGIGITKASFFLQLLGRDTACMDVHNLNLLGLHHKTFAKVDSADKYYELVNEKGSEFWWDNWCKVVHHTYEKHFDSAEQISNLHLGIIKQDVTNSFKKREVTHASN